MISVKGMTWGTPEFITIAKRAEAQGEADQIVEEAVEVIEFSEMSTDCWERVRERVAEMFDLCDGDCEWS